jgi:hypothetical protein
MIVGVAIGHGSARIHSAVQQRDDEDPILMGHCGLSATTLGFSDRAREVRHCEGYPTDL